jgi:hypothetical protein
MALYDVPLPKVRESPVPPEQGRKLGVHQFLRLFDRFMLNASDQDV